MITMAKQNAIPIEIVQPLSAIQTILNIRDDREGAHEATLTIRSQSTKIF